MDSVLFTVSLLRGREALHAGAFATSSGAVAIAATPGRQDTLLGQLLREGHAFVTDDILALTIHEDAVFAHPGPPFITLRARTAPASALPWARLATRSGPPYRSSWSRALRRLVLLHRRAGARTSMDRVEHPLAPLVTHLLKFPRTSERELARFSLASAIATHTEIFRLTADLTVSPQRLAALTLEGLGGGRGACLSLLEPERGK